MAIPLNINGAIFEYPQNFDEDWGIDATGWAQAVTNGALYLSGGSFPLTAAVDFGSSFGMSVKSITSKTASPSSTGYLRLAKTDSVAFRNNANSGDLLLAVNGSDALTFNGAALGLTSLASSHIFVGNGSNVPTDVALSGDATLANTGALTIANSAITNAKVSASAAIAITKLATLTSDLAVITDSSGFLAVSPTTSTELSYVHGVTSSIQTQLATYLPLAGGTMSGAISMASHKITSLTSGTAAGDAVNVSQVRYQSAPIQTVSTVATSTTASTFQPTNCTAPLPVPAAGTYTVKVTVTGTLTNSTAGNTAFATIFRGGTDLSASGNGFAQTGSTGSQENPISMTFIDQFSAGGSGTTVYTVRIKNLNGTNAVGFGNISDQVMILEVIS